MLVSVFGRFKSKRCVNDIGFIHSFIVTEVARDIPLDPGCIITGNNEVGLSRPYYRYVTAVVK